MKQTLVVYYHRFGVGGIETNMANIMNNALQKNRRVIWVGNLNLNYDPAFSYIMENKKLEKVCINYSSIRPFPIPTLQFDVDEEVIVTVFSIRSLYLAYKLRETHRNTKIKIYYLVPLFTGRSIFLEQPFKGALNRIIKNFTRNLYLRIYNDHNLHFFSNSFYKAIESTYDIRFNNPDKYCVPAVMSRTPLILENVISNYRNKQFTIISAGRFEFPHKGFVLGLVESFTNIHQRHPNTKLILIGDGPNKNRLMDKIRVQPLSVQSAIEIRPPVSQDELIELMKRCNLNISVAGCAVLGAKAGVPTIPARHFCEQCEVYGLFPESKDMITSTAEGKPVEDYIELVIEMHESEYLKLAADTYHCFDDVNTNTEYPFDYDCDTDYIPSKLEYFKVQLIYTMQRIVNQLSRLHIL